MASPHAVVGAADDRGLEDGGVRLQDRLDLGGRDVLAAGDDRVGLAPDDLQEAVVIEGAEVAGVQPRARVRARRSGR